MNPDVVRAIDELTAGGLLGPEVGHRLRRVARRELVSVRAELRAVLYLGVLALTAGTGLLVYENLDRIGPLAILLGLWTATGLAALFVLRHLPPSSWKMVESTHLAFDYVLLLAVLLLGSSLAYSEVHFTTLGELWPFHLLVLSLVALVASVRGDSRVVFGLALSTFAAWRGVSLGLLERRLWSHAALVDSTVVNSLLCGALFILVGHLTVRFDRKAHFEPVAVHLGWMLVLGAIVAEGGNDSSRELVFALVALLVGAALSGWSVWRRRPLLFAFGVVAAYIGLSMLVLRVVHMGELVFFWFAASTALAVVGLLVVSRRFGTQE